MADLFYTTDQGPAILEAGKAYYRVGLTLGLVNDAAPDVNQIDAIVYANPDIQNKTSYSAIERAVANYELGNVGAGGYSPPVDANWHTLLTVPADGVLRAWAATSSVFMRKNAVDDGMIESQADSEINGRVWEVEAGDIIQVKTNGSASQVFYGFLPYIYPVV